ncbi:hypothetical protein IWX84_001853 [Flavobacterium sp. CG_9.10]|nr:hypothetical protein [Flavobacterium sp. CG_9.10]MBG6110971.1 hypothetical protein [Flavobacterium sp. CG_9.10]
MHSDGSSTSTAFLKKKGSHRGSQEKSGGSHFINQIVMPIV